MTNILEHLISKKNLDYETMQYVMHGIMHGEYSSEWIASFLTAMRIKGIVSEELLASVVIMQKLVTKVMPNSSNVVDVVGTGGDGIHTFNISTASMLVASSCGAKVAKHGNRGISSKSGSADVLEALGVNLQLNPNNIVDCIDNLGLGFMFAPNHHPAMKYVAPVRKILGIRTFFNVLGPLTNPAGVKRMLMGVYSREWLEPIAGVLNQLGFEHAWVVCAENGMDEISSSLNTYVYEVKNGKINSFMLDPTEYGFAKHDVKELYASNAMHSAEIITQVLKGSEGAAFDMICINAAATLYIGGIVESLEQGIELAKLNIKNGNAYSKLKEFVHYTKSMASNSDLAL
jgi:anthranilate phosphoribosyltransferase